MPQYRRNYGDLMSSALVRNQEFLKVKEVADASGFVQHSCEGDTLEAA